MKTKLGSEKIPSRVFIREWGGNLYLMVDKEHIKNGSGKKDWVCFNLTIGAMGNASLTHSYLTKEAKSDQIVDLMPILKKAFGSKVTCISST